MLETSVVPVEKIYNMKNSKKDDDKYQVDWREEW